MKKLTIRYYILKVPGISDGAYENEAIISIESRTKNPLKDKLSKPLFEAKILYALSSRYKGIRKVLGFTNIAEVGDSDYLTLEITFQYIEDKDFGDAVLTEFWYLDPIELI